MAIKIVKKTGPPVKPTAADSVRAVQIKKRNVDINNSLTIVKSYAKSHPGKDPAKLAAKNVKPGGAKLGDSDHNIDVQMRQVRDTTFSNALNQAVRERTSKEAGVPVRIRRKSGVQ